MCGFVGVPCREARDGVTPLLLLVCQLAEVFFRAGVVKGDGDEFPDTVRGDPEPERGRRDMRPVFIGVRI